MMKLKRLICMLLVSVMLAGLTPARAMGETITDEMMRRSLNHYVNFLETDPEVFRVSEEEIWNHRYLNGAETTEEQKEYIRELTREIVKDCTTPDEQIDAVAYYLASELYYDYDSNQYCALVAPYEVLTERRTLCQGYMNCFYTMMCLLGYPCVNVISPEHGWNMVYNGERWRLVDTTWASLNEYKDGLYLKASFVRSGYFDLSANWIKENFYHLINDLPLEITGGELAAYPYRSLATHYSVPDSVIEMYARLNASLKTIYIPDSVEVIGEYVFYYCKNLTTIYYGGTKAEWDAIEKEGIPENAEIVFNADEPELPEIPELTVTLNSDGKPILRWNKVDGAEKYEIYFATDPVGEYKKLWTGSGTQLTHNSASLDKTYYYRVRAVSEKFNGGFSMSKIVAGVQTLQAPTLTAGNDAATGKIVLTWDAVEGAEKYEVYRATSQDGAYTLLKTMSGTKLTNTSAEPGMTYHYKVRAVRGDSKSAFSAVKSRTCDCARPTVTLSNNESSGKIVISWNKVEGASKYEVYRSTSKDGEYTLLKTMTGTKLTNTSTEPGKTYYYKVRALGSISEATSAYSAVKYRTCDYARPTVTLSNNESSGKIVISWNKVEGASKYEVYRSASKDGEYTLLKTMTGTKLTNTSTEPGKTYYYKVRALGSVSTAASAYSEVKSRTCDLERPTLTVTTNSKGQPVLTWDAVQGAVKYQVYRATSKNGTYTLLKTMTGRKLTNTSVEKGVTYYYKVRAVCSVSTGNSAYSTVQSVTVK